MNVEEEIKKCEVYLKQIKQYDPDPFYVDYFFNKYINSINNIINGIFEEANINFGLFITEKITQRKFNKKANMKKDANALKFLEWFSIKYKKEHENPYPNFMNEICQFKNKNESLPEIKIRIRAIDRYKNDFNQEIKIDLKNGKIISKEQVDIEIKMTSENSNVSEKSPSESHAEVIVRMFPSDANPAGNVFGGEILKNIDKVAGIVAQRHSQSNAVTVSLDSVNFLKPVFVGNVLFLNARINYVHNSSMEIEVKAEAEDIVTGIRTITATAFVTFVALGKNSKPIPVPNLALKTDEDRVKFEEGKSRMEIRLKNRQK